MKKIFLTVIAAASLCFLSACSEDESEPTLEELCATGLNEDCLVGTWNLKGIESLDKSQTIDFRIDGYKAKTVSGEILTSAKADDFNDFQHPEVVAPKPFSDAKLKNGVLTVQVPAKSIVVLNIN